MRELERLMRAEVRDMKLSPGIRNRKTILYILGFSTLAILFVHSLDRLRDSYNNDVLRVIGDRQLVAARSLAAGLRGRLEVVADNLTETAELTSSLLNVRKITKSVPETFFSEFVRKPGQEPDAQNGFIVSVRWIDQDGGETLALPLNGEPLSPLESFDWTTTEAGNKAGPSFQLLGPGLSMGNRSPLWVIVPVRAGDKDRIAGFWVAEVNFTTLITESLLRVDPAQECSDLGILNRRGDLIYSQNHLDMIMGNVLNPEERCVECHTLDLQKRALRASSGWGNLKLADGHTDVFAFSAFELPDDYWTLMLAFPEPSMAALFKDFNRYFYRAIFAVLALLGLLSSLLVNLRNKRVAAEEQARYLHQRTALLREKKEMDHRYIGLVERANDAIYILQGDRFVLVNKAFEELHGYTSKEILSPDFDLMSLVAPEFREYVTARGEKRERGEELEQTYEFRIIRKNGRKVDVEANVTYIQFQGKPAVQGVLRDITAKKQFEEEMKQNNIELEMANKELRELDQMKNNFISTISHELRTPLTSIKGSLDILMKGMMGGLDEKKKNILSICQRNSERLIGLVNDLLEVQRLEAVESELRLEPIEIEDLIPGIIEKANGDSSRKGIELKTRIDSNGRRHTVMADQSRISDAISKLLSNAIKFSDRGSVLVEVAYINGDVQLSVSDEGIGVPEAMKEKIFEKFTQVDGGITRKRGGSGLGLTLARMIVERHGGRMWVESREGAGSRFTFSLPCQPPGGDKQGSESRMEEGGPA